MNPILITALVCIVLVLLAVIGLGITGQFRDRSDAGSFFLLGLWYTFVITLISAEVVLWINTAHDVVAWLDMPFTLAFIILGIIPFVELILLTAILLGVMLPALVSEAT